MKQTKFCAYEQTAHTKFTHYHLRYKKSAVSSCNLNVKSSIM